MRKQSERNLKTATDRADVEVQRLKLELLQNNDKWEKKHKIVVEEAESFQGDLSRAVEYVPLLTSGGVATTHSPVTTGHW
jgi:hypothetical protein